MKMKIRSKNIENGKSIVLSIADSKKLDFKDTLEVLRQYDVDTTTLEQANELVKLAKLENKGALGGRRVKMLKMLNTIENSNKEITVKQVAADLLTSKEYKISCLEVFNIEIIKVEDKLHFLTYNSLYLAGMEAPQTSSAKRKFLEVQCKGDFTEIDTLELQLRDAEVAAKIEKLSNYDSDKVNANVLSKDLLSQVNEEVENLQNRMKSVLDAAKLFEGETNDNR